MLAGKPFHSHDSPVNATHGRRSILCSALIALFSLFSTGCTTVTNESGFTEKLPAEVRNEIAVQISRYFNGDPVNGVPLLDPKIDWNNAHNWPDEFSFKGHEFEASYGTFGSDWFSGPDSRAALKSGPGYFIRYPITFPAPPWRHGFHCFWSRHGFVKTKGIKWANETVFTLQFYPDGTLFMFTRQTADAGYRIDVYNRSGRIIGSNHNHSRYTWRGKEITSEAFHDNLGKIWSKYFPSEG